MHFTIISGGQTGAERAALDWARARQLTHGGWCSKDRVVLDGRLPHHYQLRETHSHAPVERTEWNIRDSDTTLIFTLTHRVTGGALRTAHIATHYSRPVFHLHPSLPNLPRHLARFAARAQTLHITGSTETEEPGIYQWVGRTLNLALLTQAAEATYRRTSTSYHSSYDHSPSYSPIPTHYHQSPQLPA